MDEELDLESPAWKQLLRTPGARPSRSAEAARERELAEIRALSAAERIGLALRLGRRARALREGYLAHNHRVAAGGEDSNAGSSPLASTTSPASEDNSGAFASRWSTR